ncbi:MAG: hypothetical protein JXA57_06255 [Armatimonadetes bacterium]|nr:hypothetical protein [Armatimonadota bacterium]
MPFAWRGRLAIRWIAWRAGHVKAGPKQTVAVIRGRQRKGEDVEQNPATEYMANFYV